MLPQSQPISAPPCSAAEIDRALLDGMWVWDLAAGRCWCSANLMRQTGLGQEAAWMAGEAWHAWVAADDRPGFDRFWRSLCSGSDLREGCQVQLAIPGSGNQWTARILGLTTERDAAGAPRRLVGFIQDRTADRLAATVVGDQDRNILDLALRNTPVVVQIFSRTELLYLSANCEQVFGYTRAEYAGLADFALVHPDDRDANRAGMARCLADPGTVFGGEMRIVRKDGTTLWVSVSGCYYREGPLAGSFVSCSFSIDERKRLELELRRHRDHLEELVSERTRALEEANARLREEIAQHRRAQDLLREREAQLIRAGKLSAIGTLVAGVAHEVQTPAATIATGLDLLADGAVPAAELPAQVERMRRSCRHIVEVVENLKDFAREQSFSSMETLAVAEVVEAAAALVRDLARRHRAELAIDLPAELSPVFAARRRLVQVLVNLLINACQALPAQGGRVAVTASAGRDGIRIQVDDDGCGIPADQLDRLCEPFFTTKADRGGLGLGLAVSFGIVREHGGELAFARRPTGGTRATLLLPRLPELR